MSAPESPSAGSAPPSFSFQKALLISKPTGPLHLTLLHLKLETAKAKMLFSPDYLISSDLMTLSTSGAYLSKRVGSVDGKKYIMTTRVPSR